MADLTGTSHRGSAPRRRRRGARRRFARQLARRVLAPVEAFLAIEAASGILLLAAAAVALLWANSPWRASYAALWHLSLAKLLPGFSHAHDLHFWINDGVMTIFFVVVGIEIRREIHAGELSDLGRAALPFAAAVGGMAVPAGIFLVCNRGLASANGWGIPMATDIAFAIGVLTLLGSRVPPALRIFLLSIAVIDDVGAILVIALFYSSTIDPTGFAIVAAGLVGILVMQRLGVENPWAYVAPGAVAWFGAYTAGIHPTLAGVVVGLMTPVENASDPGAEPPAERILHALHGWVAFGAMPLFALANAGVALGDASLSGQVPFVLLGVIGGLVFGKPLGILGFSWLAVRLGVAALPSGTSWRQVALVGVVAGIGFTMSIFISQRAFGGGTNLEIAKVGVLVGSGVAAVLAYGLGRAILRPSTP